MKEIEAKAYLRDRAAVIGKLAQLGCVFDEPIRQIDTVYMRPLRDSETEHLVRIRHTSDGKCLFTVKEKIRQTMANTEYEVVVSDGKVMEQALVLMGYSVDSRLDKTRTTAHYNDYEICLDEVVDLGSFIEVEQFSDRDPGQVTQELFEFLMSLGVSKEDRVFKKYDTLITEN